MRGKLIAAAAFLLASLTVQACGTFQPPEAAPRGPAAAVSPTTPPAIRKADPEAGRYLATVGLCLFCHGNEAGGQPPSGGRTFAVPKLGKLVAGNLTADRAAGLGNWSDAEIKGAIWGVTKGGDRLAPIMPYASYGRLAVQDLDDLVIYLKNLAPQANKAPASELTVSRDDLPRPPRPTGPQRAPTSGVGRGEYLVLGVGACSLCHTPKTETGLPDGARPLSGARVPHEPNLVAPNITPDRETGIGRWDKAAIIKALKEGVAPGGKMLGSVHGSTSPYQSLTAEDLGAIAEYLLSLSPSPSSAAP